MGLFDKIFGNRPKPRDDDYGGVFRLLDWYRPVFTSYSGGLYESELIRAAINARATHISKLSVETQGAARPALQVKLRHGPNEFQTWGQFLYRLSTILDVHNTAFITPVFDQYGEPSGVYAPLPHRCEVVQYNDVPYLRYEFGWGDKAAVELAWCGVMTKYQYRDDIFGESNKALLPTLDLIHIQNQGIEEGVKSAASYRFMATLTNFAKPEDLANERKRFTAKNLARDAEGGGLLLFPNTYKDVKQVDVKPWVVDAEQMRLIKDNVFEYFGVNEDVLTNKTYGDAWSAFYEGAVEPFAIQFSDVMTKMLFTFREQSQGNMVMATANRLQYMSTSQKVQMAQQLLDRGVMSINEARELFNYGTVENGDVRFIRGEYKDADAEVTQVSEEDSNGEE